LSTHSLQRQNVLYGLHAQSKEVRSGVFKIFLTYCEQIANKL